MDVHLLSYLVAASAVLALAVPAFAQSSSDVTLNAVRLDAPLTVDGHLDEEVYTRARAV